MNDKQLENYYNELTSQINIYYSTIVIPIGILLNSITILVFVLGEKSKINPNSNTISILNIGLCFYEILALLNSILFSQLLPSIDINVMDFSLANCIGLNWWRRTIGQATSWLQVVLTFERFVSVVYVNKINLFKSKRIVLGILLSVFPTLGFVNMGEAWFYIQTLDNDTINSTAYQYQQQWCTSSNSVALATDVVNVLFRFLIPFVVMLTMNILLSRALYRSKKRITNVQLTNIKKFRRERNYTITIIGFNCVFFVLNIPWAIWYVLFHVQQSGSAFQSSLDDAVLNFFSSIVFSIFYLNNSSFFILNICFNRWFREQFLYLIKLQWWRSSANIRTIQTVSKRTNIIGKQLMTKVGPL